MKIFSKKSRDPFAEIMQCIREGDYERALGWFRTLLKRDPKNTRIRLRYADAVARTGREDEAVRQYQMVAEDLAQAGFKIQALALNKKIVSLDPGQATVEAAPPTETAPLRLASGDATLNSIDSSNGSPPSPEPQRLELWNGLSPLACASEMRQPRTGDASEADAQAVPKLDVAHHSDSESDAPSSASVQMAQTEIWVGEPPFEFEVEEVTVGSALSGRPHTEAATGEADRHSPIGVELGVGASIAPSPTFEFDEAQGGDVANNERASIQPTQVIEIVGWDLVGSESSEEVNDRDESSETARAKKANGELELDILIEDVLDTAECDPDAFTCVQEDTDLATFGDDSENLKGERAADEPVSAPPFAGLPPRVSPLLNAREIADAIAWLPPEETDLAGPSGNDGRHQQGEPAPSGDDGENLKRERAADEPGTVFLFGGLPPRVSPLLDAREIADAIAWLQPEETDLAGPSRNDGRHQQGEPAPSGADELIKIPLFSGLNARELAGVARALVRHTVEAGTVILSALESGNSMLIVSSGEVEVTCQQRGRRARVATFAEGDFFDELSVLSGLPSGAAVTALANSELLSLKRVDLSALVGLHPAVESQVQKACEERVTANRLMAVERRDAMEESEEGRASPKLFDGEWLLKLRRIRTQGGRLVGHLKRAPRRRKGSRASLWETAPSFLGVSAAPAADVKQGIIPFDGAHLEFTNLAAPRETAKAAKSFTEKFGPLLWDGHYESKLPDGGSDSDTTNERTPTRFDWNLPLERFWSEQRRFHFLFRLGVLMTPTHAGTLGRDTPPSPEIRAAVLRTLRKNVEAFGEIECRLIDLTHPVGVFESAPKPSEDKSHHGAELARVMDWLKLLEGNVLESPDHWTEQEYLTWLTTAEGVGEILNAARRKTFKHAYDIQEGWKERAEFHGVLDALYFALGEALFGNHGYRLCPMCPRVYHHIDADSDTCCQKCAEAGRKKRRRKKPRAQRAGNR